MRNGAEPVPDALSASGVEHNLAAARRDVEFGPVRIAKRNQIERPRRVISRGHAPLVAIDDVDKPRIGGGGMKERDGECHLGCDAVELPPIDGRLTLETTV